MILVVAEEFRRINSTRNAVDLSGRGHTLAAHAGDGASTLRAQVLAIGPLYR